jgi:hypothetical protein
MAILLLVCLLASIATLVTVAVLFLGGQSVRAASLLRRWGTGVAVYLAIVIAVAALPGNSDRYARGPHCDDDWCMSVDNITATPGAPGEVAFRVSVRIFSLANRGPRSARGAWLYLTDEHGRRFTMAHDPAAIPIDVSLRPGETVATSLTFNVPVDASDLYFTGGVEGIHYASFIIGNGDLLHKPRIRFRIR